jgi:2,3-diketo-5-methylthio-1-phosphopentane phosphatase
MIRPAPPSPPAEASTPARVLVSDFDGTITARDFYQLAVERLLTPADMQPWADYRAGRITHFTAMQRIFACIRAPEERVLAAVRDMRPDPLLAAAVADLRSGGWHVVVASAGCEWYISRILAAAGVELEVHANLCRYCEEDGSLRMEEPVDSPFHCPETGIDKAAIVRFHQRRGAVVAYAGDGFTDAPAALLVRPEYRFARADLAAVLDKQRQPWRPFCVWSDVAGALLERDAPPARE